MHTGIYIQIHACAHPYTLTNKYRVCSYTITYSHTHRHALTYTYVYQLEHSYKYTHTWVSIRTKTCPFYYI